MNKINHYDVGEKIRHFRNNANMTQERLSELTGISRNHISSIENDVCSPSIDVIIAITNALDVSANDLLADIMLNSEESIIADFASILTGCTTEEQSFLIENLISTKQILSKYILR